MFRKDHKRHDFSHTNYCLEFNKVTNVTEGLQSGIFHGKLRCEDVLVRVDKKGVFKNRPIPL